MPTPSQLGTATRFLLLGAAVLSAAPAAAQRATSSPSSEETPVAPPVPVPEPSGIVFGGELETHLESDFIASSRSKPRVSVFNDTALSGFANFGSWASLNAEAKLERNRNTNLASYFPDRNAFFRSEGLTLRQFYATVRPLEGLAFYGGKIHPAFGSAYDQAPGQFYNFGTDYEQDERIGLGVEYGVRPGGPSILGLDRIRLAAETFYLDTSDLSRSFLSAPSFSDLTADRARRFARNQYGPSNTGNFDSFTLSLRGGKSGQGLAWQASLTREATAEPGGRTESGQSIGASFDPSGSGIRLTSQLGLTPYFEYAHFTNFFGIAGLERHYAVGGVTFSYLEWEMSVAAGLRHSAGAASGTDHQENISLSYEIAPELRVGAGLNFIRLDGRSSVALSPVLSYKRSF